MSVSWISCQFCIPPVPLRQSEHNTCTFPILCTLTLSRLCIIFFLSLGYPPSPLYWSFLNQCWISSDSCPLESLFYLLPTEVTRAFYLYFGTAKYLWCLYFGIALLQFFILLKYFISHRSVGITKVERVLFLFSFFMISIMSDTEDVWDNSCGMHKPVNKCFILGCGIIVSLDLDTPLFFVVGDPCV